MFNSDILDVAIGLVFIYLLFSLICSVINEWIAAVFSLRAKNLEEGIRNLLHEPEDENQPLAEGIYNHSMIAGLFKKDWLNNLTKPAYIPARSFAAALLDTIAPADVNSSQTIDDVRQAIENLPPSRTKTALLTLINQSQNDLQRLRQNVENWYDDAMDRVSGWYKRKTQVIILVLAVLVAVISNADSVAIVNTLSHNPALRAAVVTAAEEHVKTNSNTSPEGNTSNEKRTSLDKISDVENKLGALHVPLGWDFSTTNPNDPRAFPGWSPLAWLIKIFGLFLTAVALSLGAPFWFDILNKFIVIRSTVKPREKSPDEASKDNTEEVQSAQQVVGASLENALLPAAPMVTSPVSLLTSGMVSSPQLLSPVVTTASVVTKTGQDLITLAKTRLGEEYILGALAPMNNAAWHGPWDCAEFVSWCVYQLTGKLYGCRSNNDDAANTDAYTGWWGRDAGTVVQRITIKQATNTPGAILLRLPHPNMNGHIVISDGQGGTIEAHSHARGVVTDKVAGRNWNMGILIPEFSYTAGTGNISVTPPDGVYKLTAPPYMSDATVLEIQKALKANGIDPGVLDGEYGPKTAAAVYSFQIKKGLLADGEAGPETLAALGIGPGGSSSTPPTGGGGTGTSPSSPSSGSPASSGATHFAGLDMGDYPGDKLMKAIFNNPYVFTGYYLNSPCHRDKPVGHWEPWMGHWKTLKAIGWGFVVVYVGQQMEGASKCGQNNLTRSQGATDADDAILKAAKDDLTENAIIFLDIEAVNTVTQALADYVRGWIGGLLDAGSYKPGIYCHHKNAGALFDAAQVEYEVRGLHNESPAFWVVNIKNNFDVRKNAPADSGVPYASIWQGKIDIKSEVHGQVTIKSLDHNVANSKNPSNV